MYQNSAVHVGRFVELTVYLLFHDCLKSISRKVTCLLLPRLRKQVTLLQIVLERADSPNAANNNWSRTFQVHYSTSDQLDTQMSSTNLKSNKKTPRLQLNNTNRAKTQS